MKNLIKADFYCLSKSLIYKTLFVFEMIYGVLPIVLSPRWQNGYMAFCLGCSYSWHHNNIGMILAASFICTDYEENAWANRILSGHSRNEILTAKIFAFFVGMFSLNIFYTICTTGTGCIMGGFGCVVTMEVIRNMAAEFILGNIGLLTETLVIAACASVAKKPAKTMALVYLITYPFEFLKNNFEFMRFKDEINSIIKYSYTYQMSSLAYGSDGNHYLEYEPLCFLAVMLVTMGIAGAFIYKQFRDTEF